MLKKILFLGLVIMSLQVQKMEAQTVTLDSTTLTASTLAVGVQVPWEILWGPDAFIWATERRGRILRIDPLTGDKTTVLNHQASVEADGEAGMLGMALHPDFLNTPLVYVVYNYFNQTNGMSERLASFEWTGTELINENILLDPIPAGGIHNGSRLLVTTDNKILMTTGDTGSGNLSQNLNSLAGKTLRINLDGSIPADNPIADSYIYSFGHRNAQGLAFGPNGQIYASEHGAQQYDEFNIIEENRNYGWPNVQGLCNTSSEISFCNNNNVKEPLIEWSPCVAVNGIEFYDHPAIPEWKGKMLMAVLGGFVKDPRLSVLTFNADGTAVIAEDQYFDNYGRIRDICINPTTGSVYMATNGDSYPGSGPNVIIEWKNLDYTTISSTKEPSPFSLKVFPNPVNIQGTLEIEVAEHWLMQPFQLVGYNGQVYQSGIVSSTNMTLSTKDLQAGSYYLWMGNEKQSVTKKIVVQ